MSDFSMFMKKNKKVRENSFYPATKNFVDEAGEPLLWEIKPITTEEDQRIQMECTKDVPIPGKRNQFRQKLDANLYLVKQAVAAIVYPNLNDAALQDSYGVKTPEDLLKAMIDNPSEFSDLLSYIREQSGFEAEVSDEVEEAKN